MGAAAVLLVIYGAALAAGGLWVSRRLRRASDFFVAGRRLGPGLLAATVLAANIGAGSTVGVTGLAYEIGASAWWWVGSAALGTLALGLWVGPRMWEEARARGCYTVGDYLNARFGSSVRGPAVTMLWVGSVAILAGQLVALGAVLEAVAGLVQPLGIVFGAAVVLAYYGAGGLWSASRVNVVELAVKLVAFPLALAMTASVVGGWRAVREVADAMGAGGAAYLSPVGIGWLGVAGYVGVLAPSFVISPGLLQKCFGARDAATVRRALTGSAAVLVAFAFLPTGLGLLARARWSGELDPDTVLPRLLVEVLPPWLGALTLAAVVSAELSSADAVLFMLSTSLSRDLYQAHWRPSIDDAGLLRAGRLAALAGLGLAAALAVAYPSVIGTLTIFYGVLIIALAVPLLGGLFVPRLGRRGAVAAMLTAVPVTLVAVVAAGGPQPAGFWPYLLGAAAGVAAAWLAQRR